MNNENVKAMIENGVAQLIILEGKAPEQYNPQPVSISGNIDAPSLFIEKRKDTFDALKSYAKVSKTEGRIQLIVNEQSVVNKYTVEGLLKIGKAFDKIGINTPKSYEPNELSAKLRLLRSLFPSHQEHMTIVTTLRNLVANVSQKLQENNDLRGNIGLTFKQIVTSNMPETFTMCLPLIEGQEPVSIQIEVILEAKGTDITCFLESVNGAELIDQIKEKLISEEVEKIKDSTTVIYY